MAAKEPTQAETDLAVPVGEIPLPPEDVLEQADAETSAPAAKAEDPKPEVASLEFEDNDVAAVPLVRPFKHEGRWIRKISIRPMITAESGDVIRADGTYDRYDAYALMTGLPAPVLRGLDARDGEEVIGIAYDFLPRVFRANRDGE